MNTIQCEATHQIEPALETKHMSVDHAIERLAEVNFQFSRLLDKIVGGDIPPQPKAEPAARPSLLEILNQGGNRIADQAEQISSKISELDALLF